MSIVRELFARIGLQTDAASFAEGNAAVELAKSGLEKLVDIAKEVVANFVEVVKGTAEAGDQIKELSQSSGVGTEALQILGNAAKSEGVSIDGMAHSLTTLTRMMAAAKGGSAETAAAFKKVGVSIVDAKGKLRAADQVFLDLSTAVAKMPDGAEKTALAFKTLGRSGPEMIKVLNMGRTEIEEMGRAGLILTDEQIEAGDELIKTNRRLGAVTGGIWKAAIAPLLPVITELLKSYLAWRKETAAVMKLKITQYLGALVSAVKAVGTAFGWALAVVDNVRKNWRATIAIIALTIGSLIVANSALVVSFITTQAAAIAAAVASAAAWLVAAAPVLAVVAALAILYGTLDDIRVFLGGGDSFMGRRIDEIFGKGQSAIIVEQIRDDWAAVSEAIQESYEWSTKLLEKVWSIAKWMPAVLVARGSIAASAVARRTFFTGGNAEDVPFGPQPERTGVVGSLLTRARERRERRLDEEHPAFGPELPPGWAPSSPPTDYSRAGRGTVLAPTFKAEINFHGTASDAQQAGPVLQKHLDDWWDGKMEHTAASFPGGD